MPATGWGPVGDPQMMKSSTVGRLEAIKARLEWILIFILDWFGRSHLSKGRKRMAILSFDYVSSFITVKGVYEGEELDFLFEYLAMARPDIFNGTALDIGANIGNHAMYFSERFERVVCFEPNPLVFDILSLNAKRAGNVQAVNVALSDRVGEGTLRFDPANLGSGSLTDPGDATVANVPIETLDSRAEEFEDVRLIKLDVQGAEMKVLEGGRRLIEATLPVILFEQTESEIEDGTAPSIELLKKMDYRFMVINTKLFRPIRVTGKVALLTDLIFDAIKPPVKTLEEATRFENQTYGFIVAVPAAFPAL